MRPSESAIDKVSVTWSDVDERILVADLRGNIVTDHRPMHRLWVSATATKNGVTQANGSNLSGRQGIEYYTDDKLGEVAQQAIDRGERAEQIAERWHDSVEAFRKLRQPFLLYD